MVGLDSITKWDDKWEVCRDMALDKVIFGCFLTDVVNKVDFLWANLFAEGLL